MTDEAPPQIPPNSRLVDALLHLLDRQVLDSLGVPVTTVDDLEIGDFPEEGGTGGAPPPVVTALLCGPVLATRIFGGRPPRGRLVAIPWTHVVKVGTVLRLDVVSESLDITWVERWVRDRIIGRIPGGRHDPE